MGRNSSGTWSRVDACMEISFVAFLLLRPVFRERCHIDQVFLLHLKACFSFDLFRCSTIESTALAQDTGQ
jgi:hypothetical protein